MIRLGNKEIPNNKNIFVALTYIKGIGKSTSRKIIKKIEIKINKKVKDLKFEEIKKINEEVKKLVIESELEENIKKIISEQIRLRTYRGLRRSRKPNPLPINGQRTRHNARTAKGHSKLTVANKKKAPSAK